MIVWTDSIKYIGNTSQMTYFFSYFPSLGYVPLGCYRDTANRAIPQLEGKAPILDGLYWNRANPISKCAVAAMKRGFKMFAVQNGGWCAASATAPKTYDKYGKSSACKNDGEGGGWANQVYLTKGTAVIRI